MRLPFFLCVCFLLFLLRVASTERAFPKGTAQRYVRPFFLKKPSVRPRRCARWKGIARSRSKKGSLVILLRGNHASELERGGRVQKGGGVQMGGVHQGGVHQGGGHQGGGHQGGGHQGGLLLWTLVRRVHSLLLSASSRPRCARCCKWCRRRAHLSIGARKKKSRSHSMRGMRRSPKMLPGTIVDMMR